MPKCKCNSDMSNLLYYLPSTSLLGQLPPKIQGLKLGTIHGRRSFRSVTGTRTLLFRILVNYYIALATESLRLLVIGAEYSSIYYSVLPSIGSDVQVPK